MKRSFSKWWLAAAGTSLIAVTYGLVRLAYGLVLPDVQADLGVSAAAAGWISAGASVLYCLGALAGFLVASRAPRTLVVLAAGTAALGSVGVATSPSAAVFGGAAVLASAGAGLASPALVRIVARTVPASQVARTQTIVNAGTGPGLVVAGLLALVLLPDWRAAWVVSAVCAVLAGVAVLRADGGSGARAAEPTTDRAALPPASWFRQHAPLLAAALLLGAGSAAVWNYGRALLVEVGAGRAVSVVAWIALGLGGAAVIGTARWTDARSPRTAWTVTVLAVAVGTLGLGLGAPVTPVALVACVVFGWGYTAGTGALIAWTSDLDAAHAPSGTSMLFVTLVLGQALGAAVAGTGIDTIGSGVTLVVAALVALAAVPVARTVGRRDRRDRRDGLRRDAVRQNGLP